MFRRWMLMSMLGLVYTGIWLQPGVTVRAASPAVAVGQLTVVGRGVGSPDDLAIDAKDTVYFSDLAANRVLRLTAEGNPEAISPVIQDPEGLVPMPDGSLIVAEQATNRLYRVDPASRTMVLFHAVGNPTGRLGIDGLAYDASTRSVLIPDAPTGRILRLSADNHLSTMAAGFNRPTSVVLAPDGTLYVSDEFGGGVYRETPGKPAVLFASVAEPDDVIQDSRGSLIVNSLAGTIWLIDPQTGAKTALVTGLRQPPGIALDNQGNLLFTDAGFNEIFRLSGYEHVRTELSQEFFRPFPGSR